MKSTRMRQEQPLHNDDDGTTPKAGDKCEDRHQGSGTWDHRRPSTQCGGSCVLFPDDDASTLPTSHDHHPTYAATYCTALSNLNVWNVGGFEGVKSEYRCMVLVLRWCGVYGIVCTFANTLDVVLYECGVCGGWELPIPHASVPLFSLQTCWSETFRELTMRTVGHFTMLRRFVKWLQTY